MKRMALPYSGNTKVKDQILTLTAIHSTKPLVKPGNIRPGNTFLFQFQTTTLLLRTKINERGQF